MPEPTTTTRMSGFSARRAGVALGILATFGISGAYFDWQLWRNSGAIVVTLLAIAMLFVGVPIGALGRGRVRMAALAVAIAGTGLLAGQSIGPEREPLVYEDGVMTIHLTSPMVATASGVATCRNVASETEFSVNGDVNMRLDTPEQPFIFVSTDVGDRWSVGDGSPRKDGVSLQIFFNSAAVPESGKPETTIMAAGPASNLETMFTNSGGRVTFSDLIVSTRPDASGESIQFEGTIEWTC